MNNVEAFKLLLEFRESIDVVTKKQDEMLAELNAIKSLLLAILNGGVDVGRGCTAEELCARVQELVNERAQALSPGFQEAASSANRALNTFLTTVDGSDQPYS